MTTPLDIISLALKNAGVIGVGQTPHAEDSNDAFIQLNWLLGQWQRKRWLVFHLVTVSETTDGGQSYTVGPASDFTFAYRPEKIESAFYRTNGVDYPLTIIHAREDYDKLAQKTLASFPHYVFYDPAYPVGTVYFWPVPASGDTVHLTVKQQLGPFPALHTDVSLPEEYYAAILYNLVVRLRASHRLPQDPQLDGLAKDALNVLRNANAQIPRLQMPGELIHSGRYNLYSDR
jgi:hypothetical protein